MEWRFWIESEPIETEDWARRVDVLLERLEATPGVLGPVGWGSGHTLGAVFEIHDDDTLVAWALGVEAFTRALEAAAGDLGEIELRRMEITEADFEPDELVGATEIARLLGISRQRVYQLRDAQVFPEPTARLARGALWSRAEVEAWAERREVHA